MSFSTQDKIWTLSLHVTDKNGRESLFTSSSPLSLIDANISKISFHELTISEHHKVNTIFDQESNEPKYDGYKAIDSNGNVYLNQFPVANGNMNGLDSDKFLLDLLLSTEDVGDIDSYLLKLVKNNSKPYLYQLNNFLKEIDGGLLKNGMTDIESQLPHIYEKLKLISQKIQDAFLAQTGLKIKKSIRKFLKWEMAEWNIQDTAKE